MTQSFSRKKMGLAISTAMAVASPLAFANQFAGSTIEAQVTTGPNIAATTAASLGSQLIQITENPIGTVQSGSKGTIILTLDNGAKFVSGTGFVTALPAAAWSPCVITYASTSSNNTLTLNCTATAAPATAAVIQLNNITLDTSGSTVDTDVKVTLSSSSTFPALTTGATAKIATVKGNGYSVSAASTPTVTANTQVTLPTITLTENVPGMFKTAGPAVQTDEIKIDLPTGVNFVTATALAAGDGTNVITPLQASGISSTTSMSFDLTASTASTTSAGKITISGGQFFIPNGQATGDINATVSVKLAGASTATTSTLKLATVATAGTTNTFVEGTGATDYNTLYAGRSYGSGFGTSSVPALELDSLKITETAPGALAAGGVVTLTLSTGKFYAGTPGFTAVSTSPATTQTNLTAAGAASTFTITTPSTSTAGSVALNVNANALDLTSAATGDLNVTISGTTNVTGGTIKLATISKATSSSASSTVNTFIPGATTSTALADVVITESAAGALGVGTIGIKLPTNVTYDTTVAPTVTVTQAGTAVTGKVTTPATTHFVATAAGTSASVYNVALTAASSTNPYVITISGLKAKASSSASSGNFSATIFGNEAAVTAASAGAGELTYPSNFGAMPYSESVTVGKVGSATVQTTGATSSGPVSSVSVSITYAPAGNDIGKQGSVFVAAILNPGGALYCYGSATGVQSSAAWVAYTTPASCLPYFTGSLGQISNASILSNLNLTGYSGTKLYVGSGFGGALSPAGTAFNSMINNGTYSEVYVVP